MVSKKERKYKEQAASEAKLNSATTLRRLDAFEAHSGVKSKSVSFGAISRQPPASLFLFSFFPAFLTYISIAGRLARSLCGVRPTTHPLPVPAPVALCEPCRSW